MSDQQLPPIPYLLDSRRFPDKKTPLHTCRRCLSDDVWVFGRQADPQAAGSAVCRRCQFVLPFGCPDRFYMLDKADRPSWLSDGSRPDLDKTRRDAAKPQLVDEVIEPPVG